MGSFLKGLGACHANANARGTCFQDLQQMQRRRQGREEGTPGTCLNLPKWLRQLCPFFPLCGTFYASCQCLEGLWEWGQEVRACSGLWPGLGQICVWGKVTTIIGSYLALRDLAEGTRRS